MIPQTRYLASLLLLAGYCGGGCAMFRMPETQITQGGPKYDSVMLSYRVDSQALHPRQQPQPGMLASAIKKPAPTSAATVKMLAVQYPHPGGRAGYARVELLVENPSAGAAASENKGWLSNMRRVTRDHMPGVTFGDGIDQAWGLDVPSAQIDSIVQALDDEGYFGSATGINSPVTIEARINKAQFRKSWRPAPALEALTARVRREGTLVSHRQISTAQIAAATPQAPQNPAAGPVMPSSYQTPAGAQSPWPAGQPAPPNMEPTISPAQQVGAGFVAPQTMPGGAAPQPYAPVVAPTLVPAPVNAPASTTSEGVRAVYLAPETAGANHNASQATLQAPIEARQPPAMLQPQPGPVVQPQPLGTSPPGTLLPPVGQPATTGGILL